MDHWGKSWYMFVSWITGKARRRWTWNRLHTQEQDELDCCFGAGKKLGSAFCYIRCFFQVRGKQSNGTSLPTISTARKHGDWRSCRAFRSCVELSYTQTGVAKLNRPCTTTNLHGNNGDNNKLQRNKRIAPVVLSKDSAQYVCGYHVGDEFPLSSRTTVNSPPRPPPLIDQLTAVPRTFPHRRCSGFGSGRNMYSLRSISITSCMFGRSSGSFWMHKSATWMNLFISVHVCDR